jgi:putative addiction module component (TIGR02574 family)
MPRALSEILQEALALEPKEREQLADCVYESLQKESQESVDAAWDVEIERRLKEIDEGKAELRPWDETMARLKARFVR